MYDTISTIGYVECADISDYLEDHLSGPLDEGSSTDDFPDLLKWDSHYVFVYDNHKSNFRKGGFMEDFPCVGVGYTKNHFRMFLEEQKHQPVIMLDDDKLACAPIYGEIYQVPPRKVRELDYVFDNLYMTKRMKLPINAVINSKGDTKQIYAFIYVHKKTYWDKRFEQLKDADLLKANNNGKPYYNYMKKYELQYQD